MRSLDRAGGSPSADFVFPGAFTGFSGHFPGQPVLPGVCFIEAAVALLEAWHGREATVRQVSNAKFSRMVLPDQPVALRCVKFTNDDHGGRAAIVCEHDGAKAAEFVLDYDLVRDVKS
ncbi:MAG: hypothetical protein A2X46_17740 [Lentisphaerae bacterium GWF2_57_35]|nr:MAG: hypothetical protein A2X46_17740 [Lentisphaerae bacterium GWF2_57_35]